MVCVREVVVALADACGTAEVVDRDGGVAPLGEPKDDLLVEAVKARTSGRTTTPRPLGASGVAWNAANWLPSEASSTTSWCETAAPTICGMGGAESGSWHTP
jgi:hypothetical protein